MPLKKPWRPNLNTLYYAMDSRLYACGGVELGLDFFTEPSCRNDRLDASILLASPCQLNLPDIMKSEEQQGVNKEVI